MNKSRPIVLDRTEAGTVLTLLEVSGTRLNMTAEEIVTLTFLQERLNNYVKELDRERME